MKTINSTLTMKWSSLLTLFICIQLNSQDLINQGVKIETTAYGWNNGAIYFENKFNYEFYGDSCISNQVYNRLLISDLTCIERYGKIDICYKKRWLRVDTIQKNITLYNLGVLYDFNISIDSVNKYNFRLDSIVSKFFLGKNRNFYFFSKNDISGQHIYDIWLENFGSIVRDYIEPRDGLTYDLSEYFYNRINFSNINEVRATKENPTDTRLYPVKMKDKDIIYPIRSYNCDGTIDTIKPYDKCLEDTNYIINVKLVVDTTKLYKCLSTIKYELLFSGNNNKWVKWASSPTQQVLYPTTYNEKVIYKNSVIIRNIDSSCETELFSDTIKTNCNYCDYPTHNPTLSIKIQKDTLSCNDSLNVNIESSGEKDSLWYNYSPKVNYLNHNVQNLKFIYGNRYCILDSVVKSIYVDCQQLNISNRDINKTLFYPNPMSHSLTIDLAGVLTETSTLKIYTLLGNVVYHKVIKSGLNTIRLDDTFLPDGIYYLSFNNDYFKIVVEN